MNMQHATWIYNIVYVQASMGTHLISKVGRSKEKILLVITIF